MNDKNTCAKRAHKPCEHNNTYFICEQILLKRVRVENCVILLPYTECRVFQNLLYACLQKRWQASLQSEVLQYSRLSWIQNRPFRPPRESCSGIWIQIRPRSTTIAYLCIQWRAPKSQKMWHQQMILLMKAEVEVTAEAAEKGKRGDFWRNIRTSRNNNFLCNFLSSLM